MPPVLFSVRIYAIALAVLFSFLCLTLIHRAEYDDEAWFAEQSYWLIHAGYVKSELFWGYNGWEKGLYVFHKLFIYAGALVMRVAGISVFTSKLVSIFFGFAGGYLIWWYNRFKPVEQRYLALILYVGNGSVIRYLSVNRPEVMCMALGFASYLALDPPGNRRAKPVLAALLAGLAALAHLNGLIYLTAGTIWLLRKRGWQSTFWFMLTGILTLSLYGLDALLTGNLGTLLTQFRDDPATQQNQHLADKLSVLADYHHIFFHTQNEAALTLLVIVGAILSWKRIRLAQPIFLYTSLLFVSFWLLTKSDSDVYYLLFVPWFVTLATTWLSDHLADRFAWQRKLVQALLVVYMLIALVQLRFVFDENRTQPDIEFHNALLASHMPYRGSKVIAPMGFFFGQMENYKIRSLTYYALQKRASGGVLLPAFFTEAAQDSIQYIITDHSGDLPENIPARIGAYQRIFQDQWEAIYARSAAKTGTIPERRTLEN